MTATSATRPVVGAALGPRGVLVLDLGVPRDVDPAAGRLPGLVLPDVDAGPAIAAMRAEEEARLRRAVDALPAGERERAWREGRRVLGAVLHRRTLEMRGRLSPA